MTDAPLRSLWPREHGAYAQLATPLAAALIAWPGLGGALIAAAASLAFLANEPLRVALGQRGAKRRDQERARISRYLAIELGGAAIAGAAGLALAPSATLAIAAAAAVPALAALVLAWTKRAHSLIGEVVVAIALAGAAAPVAVAGGASPRIALAWWLAWGLGYACTVIAVHRVIARNRAAASVGDRIAAVATAAVAIAGGVVAVRIPLAAICVPLALIALALVVRPPPARRLRAIGVALVVASVASGALAIYTVT
ncbi:MAG: YwiC-like family protein [Acidobacteriota bacterium]